MLTKHLLDKGLYIYLLSTFLVLSMIGFSGCDRSHSTKTKLMDEVVYSYALLGPLSGSNVKIYTVNDSSYTLVYETQTKIYDDEKSVVWPENKIGSFEVDSNGSITDDTLMFIRISSGVDVDVNDDGNISDLEFKKLNGSICTYAIYKDIFTQGIKVNAISTLASREIDLGDSKESILEKLTAFSKKIFRLSINNDNVIDYKDLNAYIPNHTPNKSFVHLNLYQQLKESGFLNALLEDQNLSVFTKIDLDKDGLSWQEEVLAGSNILESDTDADGLDDKEELILGLNPDNNDSDYDGIGDGVEFYTLTDPLKSDSDGDYIPDGVEVLRGSDPLNKDENANAVLDGLDGDPFFKYQWHLKSNGDVVNNTKEIATIVGNDLDILKVYRYQLGRGEKTIIQVVDTGVERIHEDLEIDLSRSYNSVNATNDPSPTNYVSSFDKLDPLVVGHGTAVAGIIAAKANNGVGLRGIVPNAVIAGSNWLEEQNLQDLERLWYSAKGANEILVSNNSWGSYVLKDKSFEEIIQLASEQLRDKKGRIFCVAGGNNREIFGNANLSYLANNRYVIAVASLDYNNTYSTYSNPGSNLLVSAYGGESYFESPTVATTLLTSKSYYASELNTKKGAITFDEDEQRSYTYAMNGTSASTPMVSGVIALTLESCSELTYRDVKWLISYTSKKIDPTNDKWVLNKANRWHNINYGFGLIDADTMIKECRSPYYTLLTREIIHDVKSEKMNVLIPDTKEIITKNMNFDQSMIIEWLELTFESDHPYVGDLEIRLTSPSGTQTQIIAPNDIKKDTYKDGFRFSSAAFMGEDSFGIWKIDVVDQLESDSGYINSMGLKIYGHRK